MFALIMPFLAVLLLRILSFDVLMLSNHLAQRPILGGREGVVQGMKGVVRV